MSEPGTANTEPAHSAKESPSTPQSFDRLRAGAAPLGSPQGRRRTPHAGTGTVWLVGAGPGDPDLITVAGLAALRAADVVVYDRLAAPALLRETRPDALLIDAGKAPGAHTLGQEAINALLVEHGRAGRTVVRLKGGDPFVFGRGGEEALALHTASIPFRVIPGVSSAVAAPAFAGIPVTHRGVAGSVLIATGHEAADADSAGDRTDWAAMARAPDTLVFLMGVERLPQIAARLLEAGRPSTQPAALVRWGSTPQQQVLSATLGTIASEAEARGIRPPAALVVGDVVALRERLAWFETLPLFGARVLVTRTREQASGLVARLRALGAEPLEFGAIESRLLDETEALDRALCDLARTDWAIFSSQNGVRAVMDRQAALGRDARAFAGVRICAVGPATAAELVERGLRADLVPQTYSNDGLLAALGDAGISGARVLLFQADIAPPALAESLRAAGAAVTAVAAYRTVAGTDRAEQLERLLADGIDAVTFTSSSAVTNLIASLDGDTSRLEGALIVSIGPSTSKTARAAGLPIHAEAEPHNLDGLVEALCTAWQGRESGRKEQAR